MNWIRKNSAVIADLCILFIISLIPIFWIGHGYYVTGNDAAYPISISETFKNRQYAWSTGDNFGQDTSMNYGSLFIHGILASAKSIGLTDTNSQRITFIFWFYVMLVSMYVFARSLGLHGRMRYFPLIASVFYGVNFYLLELWKLGAATTFSVYAALPLIVGSILPVLTSRRSPYVAALLLAIIMIFFNGGLGFSTPLYGGVFITVFIIVLFYLFFGETTNPWREVARITVMFICSGVLTLLFNAYAFLPFLYYVLTNYASQVSGHGGVEGVISWTREVSKHTSVLNLFRLQGYPDWYEAGVGPSYASFYLSNPLLILISLVFAPISYSALVLKNQNTRIYKLLVCMALISLASILLAAGTHEPTGWLFIQFVRYIPGFAIFRSAQYKFIPALFFSFSIMFSYTLNSFYLFVRPKLTMPMMRAVGIPVVFILLFFLYHWPYFDRSNFIWKSPMTTLIRIPEYVKNYDSWVQNNSADDSRILLTPQLNTLWGAEAYSWGYSSVASIFNLLKPSRFVSNSYLLNANQNILVQRYYKEILTGGSLIPELSGILQVGHILLRNDSFHNLDWIPSESPDKYITALNNNPIFSRVWNSGDWTIYSVAAANPGKIYTVDSISKYVGDSDQIIGAILAGESAFYSVPKDGNSPDEHLSLLINRSITALECPLCGIDKSVGSASRGSVRILPGSVLYSYKLWRETNRYNSLSTDEQRQLFRLGVSLTRAGEIESLVSSNKQQFLVEPITRLRSNWTSVLSYFGDLKSVSNILIIDSLESYAISEKNILLGIIGKLDNDRYVNDLTDVISRLDSVISTVHVLRNKTFLNKTYSVASGRKDTKIFIDTMSLPVHGTNVIVPNAMYLNETSVNIKPMLDGSRLDIGAFDLSGVTSITLSFQEMQNLIVKPRVFSQRINGVQSYCMQGNVDAFDWRRKYRLTIKDSRLLSTTDYFVILHDKQNKNMLGAKVMSDQMRFISTQVPDEQVFYFSGHEGDEYGNIFFCSEDEDHAIKSIDKIRVDEVFTPHIYLYNVIDDSVYDRPAVTNYSFVDPTRYTVRLQEKNTSQILIFNENFNQNWKLYKIDSPNISRWESLMLPFVTRPVYENRHFSINGYANAWNIPENTGGFYIINFYPQQLFIAGCFVSAASIILSFIFVIIRALYLR